MMKLFRRSELGWTAAQVDEMDDACPEWREIVGQVDISKRPPPPNPYRMWLATKDKAYQARLNDTQSAAVILRSIELFRQETKPESRRNAA